MCALRRIRPVLAKLGSEALQFGALVSQSRSCVADTWF